MKLLITGICGFVGSVLARELPSLLGKCEVFGIDNLSRAGSEVNRGTLRKARVPVFHGDLRNPSDLENLPRVDWVIDAAANPSVLAGVSGGVSSRQLIEHNLIGTANVLEFCKRHSAGLVMLSTSRVYSCCALAGIPMRVEKDAYAPELSGYCAPGLSVNGVAENFSTTAPLSLYGAAKLASEIIAAEYGKAFGFPVVIDRCGVLAGAGQFGKADQGIMAFWMHSHKWKRPLRYIGFGGQGFQTRDFLHPNDLARLIVKQMRGPGHLQGVYNVSGGISHALSLANLTSWCDVRFGGHPVGAEAAERPFDVPWLVLDSAAARAAWSWQPQTSLEDILRGVADHAESHPEWLDLSSET